jgi:hypothetical protein
MTHTLDRTVWELRQERGPWERSKLYRVGLAVQAVCELESPEAAQDLIWDGVDALGGAHAAGPTLRQVLELQDVDVAAVRKRLEALDHEHAMRQQADAEANWRRATAGFRGSIA